MKPLTPKRFIRNAQSRRMGTVLVCVGDSITQGIANPNYVKPLQELLATRHVQVVNAGISGDLAVNVLSRIDGIIACRPDIVTVLVGTNDVAAQIDERWAKGYVRQKHLTEPPTRSNFEKSLAAIADRLQQATNARIALCEIPIFGENLHSAENCRVRDYNGIVHAVAQERRLTVLPLYQRLVELLPSQSKAPPFDGTKRWMFRALARHFILRQDWDRISAIHGLTLLTDHIHLNDRGAQMMAMLVEDFVDRSRGDADI